MSENVHLSSGVSALIEVLLQIAMLRPSQEQTIPHHNKNRVRKSFQILN